MMDKGYAECMFEGIRDIPYGGIQEASFDVEDILKRGKAACSEKHYLLGRCLSQGGHDVSYLAIGFYWHELPDLGVKMPPDVYRAAKEVPFTYHLACRMDKDSIIDATWDPPLRKAGFPVNQWDVEGECSLAVPARSIEEFLEIEDFMGYVGEIKKNYSDEERYKRREFYHLFESFVAGYNGGPMQLLPASLLACQSIRQTVEEAGYHSVLHTSG